MLSKPAICPESLQDCDRPARCPHYARRYVVVTEIIKRAPRNFRSFFRTHQLVRFSLHREYQIVMQVKRLALVLSRRNSMDIQSNKPSNSGIRQMHPGFFDRFPSGGIGQSYIALFYVPARQQPPAMAMVIRQQNTPLFRMQHERRTSNVSGVELMP